MCYALKADGRSAVPEQTMIEYAISRLAARYRDSVLAGVLGPDVTLIPAPRRAPIKPGSLWPAERICTEMMKHELGGEMAPCLERKIAVPKSAWAAPGERPNVKTHYDSLAVNPGLHRPKRVLVVDDVITKGATTLACVARVQDAFPGAVVEAFAVIRTMGLVQDIDRIVDPVRGTVTLRFGDAHREP